MAGFFDTLFGGGAEREAAQRANELTAQYKQQSTDALRSSYDTATGFGKQAVGAFDPLAALGNKYNAAGDVWLDALGVNGAAGNARTGNAFETTRGYDIAQRAGEEAIARRRAISGGYDAGKTDTDLADYVTSQLYNTQYQPWMQGLQSAAGMGGGYTAAAGQGQATGYGNLGNLATQYGQNQIGIYGNATNNNIAASNQQAAGEASGAKNLLGAGLSLASIAAAPFTGGLSLGGLGGSLGGLFGGGTPTGLTTGGYGAGGNSLGSGVFGGVRYPAV